MTRIEFTQSFRPFARDEIQQSIPERFDRQVRLFGSRLAIKTHRHELSYEALNRLSNRIAHAVLGSIAPRGGPIALMFAQDAPLIAAILGVLKAGNMYVALDPRGPQQHLADLLSDAQPKLILTDAVNMPVASALATQTRETIEIEPASLEGSDENPQIRLSPDAPAYIYYTSGSTGCPKGVFDDHRNVLHNIMRYTNTLGITCADRLTLLQSCEFSGAVSNIFGALLNGAALFPFDLHRDGVQRVAERLVEEKITIYHSVPAIFQRVVASGPSFPSLRVIRLEGDRVTLRDVELYKRHFDSRCVLVNGLGATETGITRQYFIDSSTKIDGAVVPIGYATEDMTTVLLDSNGAMVPIGEVGEIAIKSPYLARGYWRQPELTESAFKSCVDGNGVRIYRTGDLGRLRPDGALEYLGRKDFRVKMHGEWVDLEAIENMLRRHDLVKEAILDARPTPSGRVRLTAYLVTAQDQPLSSATMRCFLSEANISPSMIPTSFVTLEELPLDSNGKVARNKPCRSMVAKR